MNWGYYAINWGVGGFFWKQGLLLVEISKRPLQCVASLTDKLGIIIKNPRFIHLAIF